MANKYIRDYRLSYSAGDTDILVQVDPDYIANATFAMFPTEDEANDAFGTTDLPLKINYVFKDCTGLVAAPRLPESAVCSGTLSTQGLFYNCPLLKIAPMLPRDYVGTPKSLISAFYGCSALLEAPVIPIGVINASYMFRNASKLKYPVSIPASVTNMSYLFRDAADATGEMIVRGTPSSYTSAFYGTTKPITLYGDQSVCNTLAGTANNGNVTWADWYDPVPAVMNRGQGSYTTAADMTRMVRNGALAVATYAPGRMRYQTGDIVREDEWFALVEAAQTIDPDVTFSTRYDNLNRIEAAFDSAL